MPVEKKLFGCPEPQPYRSHRLADPDNAYVHVVFAVFLSSGRKYEEWLEAQLVTWAAVPYWEGRFFAIGDAKLSKAPCVNFIPAKCSSQLRDYACKMSYLWLVAAARGADWLVYGQTDHYMVAPKWEQTVRSWPLETPYAIVLSYGCGKDVTWFKSCPSVLKHGGMCGASPLAVNGAAIDRVVGVGEQSLHAEFRGFPPCPEDLANTCVLRKRGVPITWLLGGLHCPNFGMKGWGGCGDDLLGPLFSKDQVLAVHRITRVRMFEVHQLFEKRWSLSSRKWSYKLQPP